MLALTINHWPEKSGICAVLARRCEYLAAASVQEVDLDEGGQEHNRCLG
jgi:hypothetical protein